MQDKRLSVSQLNTYIKNVFDDELILKNITVFGEISEKSESGGNVFFTLKDEGSILRCVHFGHCDIPQIGESVSVTGSVDYYAKGNRVSFRAKFIVPFGEGALRREFLALKEKLRAEGLFDNHLPLPSFIKKIAVVTSDTGAVIHDLVSVVYKRHPYIDMTVYPVRVQGEGAEKEIALAVDNAAKSDCHITVVARGGGSNADLEAFNTEAVARSVALSLKPVISAVGHEVDFTLCDFCASLRAGTPSIAGENICRINETFLGNFVSLVKRLSAAEERIYSKKSLNALLYAKRLADNAHSLLYGNLIKVRDAAQKLNFSAERAFTGGKNKIERLGLAMTGALKNLYSNKENGFNALTARLDASSPLKILQKGYAKVYSGQQPLNSVKEAAAGQKIEVYMRDGAIYAETLSVKLNKDKE